MTDTPWLDYDGDCSQADECAFDRECPGWFECARLLEDSLLTNEEPFE